MGLTGEVSSEQGYNNNNLQYEMRSPVKSGIRNGK